MFNAGSEDRVDFLAGCVVVMDDVVTRFVEFLPRVAGGIAFQLAASQFLRDRRGASLTFLVLDEPFGSLDAANKQSLARSFATMLGDGFDQAFIIAHDQGILDSLPGKIQIMSKGGFSEVHVV